MSIYILVGDAFIPNKIFYNKEAAFDELKKTSPYRYILNYIPNRRDEKSDAQLVAKYTMHKSFKQGVYIIKEEKLWETDDTDYGFLYNLNPDFPKMFEYNEYDNIIKFKESINDTDLNERIIFFPTWLKNIINKINQKDIKSL